MVRLPCLIYSYTIVLTLNPGDYFWIKNGNYALETLQINCPNGAAPNRLSCGSDLQGLSFKVKNPESDGGDTDA